MKNLNHYLKLSAYIICLSVSACKIGTKSSKSSSGSSSSSVKSASLSISSASFANTTVGKTSSIVTITVSNSGDATATLSVAPSLTTHTQFAITGGTCINGATVAASGSCTILASFTPTTSGLKSDTINITYSSTNTANKSATRAISGTGLTPASLSIAPTEITNTLENTSSGAITFFVTNNGGTAGSITSKTVGTNQYSISGGTCSGAIAPAASCSINVVFSPTSSGRKSDSITVTYNNGVTAGHTSTLSIYGYGYIRLDNHYTSPVGPVPANAGEMRSIVSLQNSAGQHICNGVIIDEYHVITAAHCLYTIAGNITKILEGSIMNDNSDGNGVYLTVSRSLAHENYGPYQTGVMYQNDIAIITTVENFNNPSASLYNNGILTSSSTRVIEFGWDQPYGGMLLKDETPVTFSYAEINSVYGDVPVNTMGAGLNTGGSACLPFLSAAIIMEGNTVVGIKTHSDGNCVANVPAVYTEISNYRDWIEVNKAVSF